VEAVLKDHPSVTIDEAIEILKALGGAVAADYAGSTHQHFYTPVAM
jgi:hypothetical protein